MPAAGANLNLGLGDLQWNGPGPAPTSTPPAGGGGLNLGLGLGGGGYNPFAGPVAGSEMPNPFDPFGGNQTNADPFANDPNIISREEANRIAMERVRSQIAPQDAGNRQPGQLPAGGSGAQREAALLDQQMANVNGQRSGVSRDLDLARDAGVQGVQRAQSGTEFSNEAVGIGQAESDAKAQARKDAQVRIQAAQKAYVDTRNSLMQDSGKLWSQDATGMQKFMILAGMALAGYTDVKNAENGTRSNNAMQLMSALMEQNRASAKTKLDASASALKMSEEERDAKLVEIDTEYAAKWDDLKRRQAARLATLGEGEALTKAQQGYRSIEKAAQDADGQALETVTKFAQGQAQREAVTGRAAARAAARSGGKGKPGEYSAEDPYAGLNANQRDIAMRKDAAVAVSDLDGSNPRKAKDPVAARALNDARVAANVLRDQIQEMRTFLKEEGTYQNSVLSAAALKRRETIATAAASQLTVLNNTGVLNKDEYSRYSHMFTPDFWQSVKSADEALGQLDRNVAGSYQRKFEALTINPTTSQGVGSPQIPATRAAPGRSLEPGGVTPITPTSVPQSQAPAAAPSGGQRKQGRDGKWYVKTAYGWSPE